MDSCERSLWETNLKSSIMDSERCPWMVADDGELVSAATKASASKWRSIRRCWASLYSHAAIEAASERNESSATLRSCNDRERGGIIRSSQVFEWWCLGRPWN